MTFNSQRAIDSVVERRNRSADHALERERGRRKKREGMVGVLVIFSIAVMKYYDQGNLQENGLFGVSVSEECVHQHHIGELCHQSGMMAGTGIVGFSVFTNSDILPVTSPYLLKLIQKIKELGPKYSNI